MTPLVDTTWGLAWTCDIQTKRFLPWLCTVQWMEPGDLSACQWRLPFLSTQLRRRRSDRLRFLGMHWWDPCCFWSRPWIGQTCTRLEQTECHHVFLVPLAHLWITNLCQTRPDNLFSLYTKGAVPYWNPPFRCNSSEQMVLEDQRSQSLEHSSF